VIMSLDIATDITQVTEQFGCQVVAFEIKSEDVKYLVRKKRLTPLLKSPDAY